MEAYEAAFWPDPADDARPAVVRAAFPRYALDGKADFEAWSAEPLMADVS